MWGMNPEAQELNQDKLKIIAVWDNVVLDLYGCLQSYEKRTGS